MKKLFIFLGFITFYQAKAQVTLDQQLVNVNQSTVTSGIIYERVKPFASLYTYNQPNGTNNTADYKYFEQALSELHRASNKLKLISHYELRNRIATELNTQNVVNIGIINTQYSVMNYNFENPTLGGLTLNNDLYSQIAGKVPFYDMHALIIAPLKQVAEGGVITYKFNSNLILTNGSRTIKTLTANLGDGVLRTIINNGSIVLPSVNINKTGANGNKKLIFNVTFNDNLTMTTNGQIYLFKKILPSGDATITRAIAQPPSGSPCGFDNITEDMLETDAAKLAISGNSKRLVSDYAYQGLNESAAIQGEIEARIYYRTKNGTATNYQKTLLKPIIIVDGFDPTDKRKFEDCDCINEGDCAEKYSTSGSFNLDEHRSLVDLMGYKDTSITPNKDKNLIVTLRDNGFDVIIVNQPTYYRNGVKIDGGADFIERNAMNLASLLKKLNQTLLANNSTNQIVIVGPSMGGQISRYALAWMEKMFAETGDIKYKHNTRLWVAFDSPNLGSNVPLGDQALINLLSEDSPDAEKKYKEYLGSTASKELVMEFHQQATINHPLFGVLPDVSNVVTANLNGQITSMGLPTNAGNPYFQFHYNNQTSNGLPNSGGYPINLRKIAITNGSLTGITTGSDSEKILDIRGIQRVCFQPITTFGWSPSICGSIKLAEMQAFNMPSFAGSSRISYYDKIIGAGKHTNAPNLNSRGNMDTVPGGLYGATNDIASGITGAPIFPPGTGWQIGMNIKFALSGALGGQYWNVWTLKQFHTFIPTFSALGMKNPNQNWANSLNRNLVCTNETAFDSYYGETNNTEHTSLNSNSVNWLMKELGDSTNPPTPQAPSFPIEITALSGPNVICENTNTTFSFPDICKVPSAATWTITPNAQIISQTGYSVVITGLTNGSATITATFQNGQTFTKTIWCGKPNFALVLYEVPQQPYKNKLIMESGEIVPFSDINVQGIISTTFNRKKLNGVQDNLSSTNIFRSIFFGLLFTESIKVTATNLCGTTEYNWIVSDNNRPQVIFEHTSFYKTYPNPTNNLINIELKDSALKPVDNAAISAELFNMMGEVKRNVTVNNNIATVDVLGLPRGIYILKINIDGNVESHQVAIE